MASIDLGAIDRAIGIIEVDIDKATILSQRKVLIAVDSAVVLATPVDTGRAKSNWIPSIGTPSTDKIIKEEYDKTGGEAIQKAIDVGAGIKFGSDVYISNNLPYIGRLNDGSSIQAPAGYIEKAVQAARRAIES
jgi:hypothetical protein